MADFTTDEERAYLEAVVSDFQSKGATMSAEVDPYWFFEETATEEDRMDRLMLFMLRYFPRSFRTWEPINHLFFHFLEYTTKGLAKLPGQHGKDLDCDTPILTTHGWKTMGTIKVGDFVYGLDGQPTKVIYCSEVFTDHPCYQLTFTNDERIVAGEDHLWKVSLVGKERTLTTAQLADGPSDMYVLPKVATDEYPHGLWTVWPVKTRPTRCIQVDSPDHLFLVGESQIPTHNTTMLGRWQAAWVPIQCPSISQIYTEKNEPTAFKRSRANRMQLMDNKLLVHDFGVFQPPSTSTKPWSDAQWTIAQRTETIDTPTMAVFGAGGASLLGNRCNILVVDDPVTPENSRSEKERDNLWDWHSEAASTSPAPLPIENDRYLVKEFLVGTVFRRDDLYHRAESTDEYTVLHLPAVLDEVVGTTLSPRYCYIHPEELERRARVDDYHESLYQAVKDNRIKNLFQWAKTHGRTAYNRRFQNVAINSEDQWCQEVWLRGGGDGDKYAPAGGWPGCLDNDRRMGRMDGNGWIYVTGCDPQGGKKKSANANFVALTLAANTKDQAMRYIVEIDVGQYPLESDNPHVTTQTNVLLRHATTYKSKVIIEDNAQQAGWQGVLKKAARAKGVVVSAEGHFTDAKKNDPELGVKAMAPYFENGYMRFPYKTARDQRLSNMLIDELLYWGVHPTKDIVMALWFANNRMERMLKAAGISEHNTVQERSYVNRLATTRFPQHWSQEQRQAWAEERAAKEQERVDLERVVNE